MTYTQFEEQFLVAAYLLIEEQETDAVGVKEILERYPFERKSNWIIRALSSYEDHGWTKGGLHMGPAEEQDLFLNAHGVREAEGLMERGVRPPTASQTPAPSFNITDELTVELIPASDRLVPLDHNSAPYREVREGLAELHYELRSSNDLECTAEERERVLASLSAAQKLWEATQLKIIQIRVGIIITIKDAIALLTKAGKAVGKSLLIDTIKSIVKHKTGIDI